MDAVVAFFCADSVNVAFLDAECCCGVRDDVLENWGEVYGVCLRVLRNVALLEHFWVTDEIIELSDAEVCHYLTAFL